MNRKHFFLTTIILSAFAIALIFAIPSYAQTAMQQAEQIEKAEEEAINADSASQSRSIGNNAWDGANKGTETDLGEGAIDPKDVGTDETPTQQSIILNSQEDKPNAPDSTKTEDVTPWQKEAKALKYVFMTAMLMLTAAAALSATKPYGPQLAIIFSSIAIAASATAVGLALTLMFKYKQYAFGGMWLAVAGAGLISCCVACAAGAKAYNAAKANLETTISKYINVILLLIGAGGTFLANTIGTEAAEYIDKDAAKKYCEEHKDNKDCKTSSLPYQLPNILAESDRMDC